MGVDGEGWGGTEERCARLSGGSATAFPAHPPVGLRLAAAAELPQMQGGEISWLSLHLVPGLCGRLGWQRDPNSFIFRSRKPFLKVILQHTQVSELLWEAAFQVLSETQF